MYKIFYIKVNEDTYFYISNFEDKGIVAKFKHRKSKLWWECYETGNMLMPSEGIICDIDKVLNELARSTMNLDSQENVYHLLIWVLL